MLLNHYYYYFKSALPERLCDEIIDYGTRHTFAEGVTHVPDETGKDCKFSIDEMTENEKTHVLAKRKSNIAWLNDQWIYKEIHPYINEANYMAGWNFDWDYSETAQFTKYDKGQYYEWHADGHPNPYAATPNRSENEIGKIRKLSVTVSLNDPAEYDGGNLEFSFRNNIDFDENRDAAIHTCTEIRPKGSIVVFPSFVWHRVTPVTRGTRYSLVMWNLGHPFR